MKSTIKLSQQTVQSLQNIIENAQELLAANAAATATLAQTEQILYVLSSDVAEMCIDYGVEIATDGF